MGSRTVEPLALSVVEAAKAIGVCRTTLHNLTKGGHVPCVRVGRRILYRRAALDEWLRSNEQSGTDGLEDF